MIMKIPISILCGDLGSNLEESLTYEKERNDPSPNLESYLEPEDHRGCPSVPGPISLQMRRDRSVISS